MATLEQIAQYRPGIGTNILNFLTGGIAGQITGQRQTAEEAARARALLMQDEAEQRQFERQMNRRQMEAALSGAAESGLDLGQNANPDLQTLQRMVAQQRLENARAEIAGGLSGMGIPSAEPPEIQKNPRFGIGAMKTQAEIAQRQKEQEINRIPQVNEAKAFLESRNIDTTGWDQNRILAEAGVMRPATIAKLQSEAYSKNQGDIARATLRRGIASGEIPSPIDVNGLSDAEAIVAAKNFEESTKLTAAQKNAASQSKVIEQLDAERNSINPDLLKMRKLISQISNKDARAPYLEAAGLSGKEMTTKDRIALAKEADGMQRALNLGNAITRLLGNKSVSDRSAELFSAPLASLRQSRNKYLGDLGREDSQLITSIIQQFEQLGAGTRKDLFGASLTGNELESARTMFGSPNQANFLQNALRFIDSKFNSNPLMYYHDAGLNVPTQMLERVKSFQDKWNGVKGKIKGMTWAAPDESGAGTAPQSQPSGLIIRYNSKGELIK